MLALFGDQLSASGGPVLVVLAFLSVAGLAIAIVKTVRFAELGVGREREAALLIERFARGDAAGGLAAAREARTLRGRVLAAAWQSLALRPRDLERAREVAAQTALAGLARMNGQMRLLEAIVQTAPMLGLLGTVLGMISVFSELSASTGAVDPAALSGGIWAALTTTAAGLIVAIPFYFVTTVFEARIEAERLALERLVSAALFGPVAAQRAQPDLAAAAPPALSGAG